MPPFPASLEPSLVREGEAPLCMLETKASNREALDLPSLPAEDVDIPASEDGERGDVWLCTEAPSSEVL